MVSCFIHLVSVCNLQSFVVSVVKWTSPRSIKADIRESIPNFSKSGCRSHSWSHLHQAIRSNHLRHSQCQYVQLVRIINIIVCWNQLHDLLYILLYHWNFNQYSQVPIHVRNPLAGIAMSHTKKYEAFRKANSEVFSIWSLSNSMDVRSMSPKYYHFRNALAY